MSEQVRIVREWQDLRDNYQGVFDVQLAEDGNDIMLWFVTFTCPQGTIYAGEQYTLRIDFQDQNFPNEAPEVVFWGQSPEHEHIYSNGYICLSVLYRDWNSEQTIGSLLLSILLLLEESTVKSRPDNDYNYNPPYRPKRANWVFDD